MTALSSAVRQHNDVMNASYDDKQFNCMDDTSQSIPMDLDVAGRFGFITAGMYIGHFVKVTSENKKCKRFNLMLVSDSGHFLRKKGGAIVHTALARASFVLFDPSVLPSNELFNLNDALAQCDDADALGAIRAELLSRGVHLQTAPHSRQPRSSSSGPQHGRSGGSGKMRQSSDGHMAPEELEESRNNLYWWTDVASSSSELAESDSGLRTELHGFPCVWYGGGADVSGLSAVEVLRVRLPGQNAPGGDAVCAVRRGQLAALDEALVARACSAQALDDPAGQYLCALLAFAEWADGFRESFIWPQFAVDLFRDAAAAQELVETAAAHPLGLSVLGAAGLSRVILFLLSARHIGVAEQFDASQYLRGGRCSADIWQLLCELSLVASGRAATRSCSRVGVEYQAALLDAAGPCAKLSKRSSGGGDNAMPGSRISADSSQRQFAPVSSEEGADDRAVEDFLGRVQLLRMKHATGGQLAEVPVDLEDFVQRCGSVASELVADCSYGLRARRDYLVWNRVVAEARRNENKQLTTLCAVKVRHSVPAASSVGAHQMDLEVVLPASVGAAVVAVANAAAAGVAAPATTAAATQFTSLRYCKLFSAPDDWSLEVLHSCHWDSERALEEIDECLASAADTESRPSTGTAPAAAHKRTAPGLALSEADMRLFFSAVRRHPNSLRRLWAKYKSLSREQQQQQGDSSTNRALQRPAAPLQQVLRLVAAFFPGDDDLRASAQYVACLAGPSTGSRQQAPLQWSRFASSSGNPSSQPGSSGGAVRSPSSGQQKLFALAAGPADLAASERRQFDPSVPRFWPATLPLMRHNMYWLKTSNSPCLCVGLDFSNARSGSTEALLSVVTVCCATYHHAVSVQASKLEPLDEEIVKQCGDERAAGFALAMVDFADYELAAVPSDSPLRHWYVFPAFVRQFLHHMPTFAAWRKQAERAGRDLRGDRRRIYFAALVETFNSNLEAETLDVRLGATAYPWDETERFGSRSSRAQEPSVGKDEGALPGGATSSSTVSSPVPAAPTEEIGKLTVATTVPAKRKAPPSSAQRRRPDSSEMEGGGPKAQKRSAPADDSGPPSPTGKAMPAPPLEAPQKPPVVGSLFNMFWLSKAALPCLYLDAPERRFEDRITVLPICCATYHYPVQAAQSFLEPLTEARLKECTDERTHDFTLALIDFARWESAFLLQQPLTPASVDGSNQRGDGGGSSGAPSSSGDSFYLWPAFVLQLLNRPKEWAAWRKRVERSAAGRQGVRRSFYFEALRADYEALLTAADGSSS